MPRFLMMAAVMLLAACTTLGVKPQNPTSQSQLPEQWSLQGKLASKGLGAAVFRWQQNGGDSEIAISAPLGAGAAKISYVGGQLTVRAGDQALQHQAAQYWLQANGLAVPLDALALWVQGLPHYRLPAGKQDANRFVQAGWSVAVRKWQTVNCIELPNRMRVEKGDAVLKLGGMRWKLQTDTAPTGPTLFNKPAASECNAA